MPQNAVGRPVARTDRRLECLSDPQAGAGRPQRADTEPDSRKAAGALRAAPPAARAMEDAGAAAAPLAFNRFLEIMNSDQAKDLVRRINT